MNHIFKLISKKLKGYSTCIVVVSENASSLSKTVDNSKGLSETKNNSVSNLGKPNVTFGLISILITQSLYSDIIADLNVPTNQQATILTTASGATQVNIQTPTPSGVSMNQYSQFDTKENGTIINNSRVNTITQTAGWVQGNPWLSTGSANVVVNQVNSNHPSSLIGNIEIAGQKADFIIANPSGISVNGANIINASTMTLSTGLPFLNNGKLESFDVQNGLINFEGEGLNALGTDYTNILAKSVVLNAGIWANDLKIRVGENKILSDGTIVSSNKDTSILPHFALDSSTLGGMYASKISLIGTKDGLGVNNNGTFKANDLTLDVNGILKNNGIITSENTNIKSTQIYNDGTISSTKNVSLQTDKIINSGIVNSSAELTIESKNIENNKGDVTAQKIVLKAKTLKNSGKIKQNGFEVIDIKSTNIENINNASIGSEFIEDKDLELQNPQIPNEIPTSAKNGTIIESTDISSDPKVLLGKGSINVETIINDGGKIDAGGGVNLSVLESIKNSANINILNLDSNLKDFNNDNGVLNVSNSIDIKSETFQNISGNLSSKLNISINTKDLKNNSGSILAGDKAKIITDSLINDNGVIQSKNALSLEANSGSISNVKGNILSTDKTVDILTSDKLDNSEGNIVSASTLNINANADLINTKGLIQSTDKMDITAKDIKALDTSSVVSSKDSLDIQSSNIENQGFIGSSKAGKFNVANSVRNSGEMVSQESDILLTTKTMNNSGSILAGDKAKIITDSLINDNGVIQSKNALSLEANSGSISNVKGNILSTDKTVDILTSDKLDNSEGNIVSASTLNINANADLINTKGLIQSADKMDIKAKDIKALDTSSVVSSKDSLDIQSSNIENQGFIGSSKAGKFNVANSVRNSGEMVSQESDILLTTKTMNNSGSILAGDKAKIITDSLINDNGVIQSKNALSLEANSGSISNVKGNILSTDKTVDILTSDKLDNSEGNIVSASTLNINANADLINTKGLIQSADKMDIKAKDIKALDTSSVVSSKDSLDIQSSNIENQGFIGSSKAGKFNVANSVRNSGEMVSQESDILLTTKTMNNSGSILAGDKAKIITDSLINDNGVIQSKNALSLEANSGSISNVKGNILSTDKTVDILTSDKLDNSEGNIVSASTLNINANADLINTKGLIQSADKMDIKAKDIKALDTSSVVSSKDSLDIQSSNIENQGFIGSSKAGKFNVANSVRNSGEMVSQESDILLTTKTMNNSGSILAGDKAKIITDSLINDNGVIQSKNALSLEANSGSISNVKGNILSTDKTVDILTSDKLDNSEGNIVSASTLNINANADLINTKGLIQSADKMDIKAKDIKALDTSSVVSSKDSLDIQSSNIENQGFIGSSKAGKFNVANSVRNSGEMVSQDKLSIFTKQLNNTDGEIQAFGDIFIDASTSILNNNALIVGNALVTLNSPFIDNSNLLNTSNGIYGDNIFIDNLTLNNTQSHIVAQNNLGIKVSTLVNNTKGSLSANEIDIVDTALTPNDKKSQIVNTNGSMIADSLLNIDVKSLTNDGDIASNQDIAIKLIDGYENIKPLIVDGDLYFSTQGDFINHTLFSSGGFLELYANNIINNKNAEVSSTVTNLHAINNITNRGLIDGYETNLKANIINNIGTGRIYGDWLAFNANILNNVNENMNGEDKSATIASRENLEIGVNILNNKEHSLLYSDGGMNIGGSLDDSNRAINSAKEINNLSANIESSADMKLSSERINNINMHFTTKKISVGEATQQTLISPSGDSKKYDISNFKWRSWSRAGFYVWTSSPTTEVGSILGQTPIVEVGKQICTNENDESTCSVVAGAEYFADNPAWSYFGIEAPTQEPMKPTLEEPAKVTLIEPLLVESTDPNYNQYVADKALYDDAVKNYNELKTQYDTAQIDYQNAYDVWFADSDVKYEQLAEKVETYNDQFNGSFKAWTQYKITNTAQEDIVDISDPSKISSGGNLTFLGGTLDNDKSTILIGNTLFADANSINNIEAIGEHIDYLDGTSQYTKSRWRGGFRRYHQRDWGSLVPYASEEHTPITLNVTTVLENTNTSPAQNIDALSTPNANIAQKNSKINANKTSLFQNVDSKNINLQTSSVQSKDVYLKNKQQENKEINLQSILVDSKDVALKTKQQENKDINLQTSSVESKDVALKTQKQTAKSNDFKFTLPKTSLFVINVKNPNALAPLVQTDSKFTNYKNWLDSNYITSSLRLSPSVTQKRLGDGYYEQKLIREQIANLTGKRFLNDYSSDEAQYMALMNSAVSQAKTFNLTLGISLSAEQIAKLTGDIVWLEEQMVNGVKVLVPKVYLSSNNIALSEHGTLISAKNINLNLKNDLNNQATLLATDTTTIKADNINNQGSLKAKNVLLDASNDINNIGGKIEAKDALLATAGRDINIKTTIQSHDIKDRGFSSSRTDIKNIASLSVTNANAVVSLSANRNVNLSGANIDAKGADATVAIVASKDINLDTVKTTYQESSVENASNYRKESNSKEIGTSIASGGNILLQSGGDTLVRASDIDAKGAVSVESGGKISVENGENSDSFEEAHKSKSKGFLSSKTTTTVDGFSNTKTVSSNITGDKVVLNSNDKLTIQGSNVISDSGTLIESKAGVDILASTDTSTQTHFNETKKSGLLSNGGLSFTIGKSMNSNDNKDTTTKNIGSMVGSLNGDTTITTSGNYKQVGSSVLSGSADENGKFVATGDTAIVAKKIDIEAGYDTYNGQNITKSKQSGLTVALDVPVVSQALALVESSKDIGKSKNDKVNAMAMANTANKVRELDKATEILKSLDKIESFEDTKIGISATIGSSSSKNISNYSGTNAVSSSVAGERVTLKATGDKTDGGVSIVGSEVAGTKLTDIRASKVDIISATSTSNENSTNKSSGWNAGVVVNSEVGIGGTIGGNLAKGKGDGQSVTHTNSHVGTAGSTTNINTSAINIAGGQVKGATTINADTLNISSLQDTSTYKSKQQSGGGQVTVGLSGSVDVQVNYSQSKIKANYASVGEQSGIFSGDDGYNININDKTTLSGAVISSSQKAVDEGKSNFKTSSLQTSDIQNRADYSADGFGISASVSNSNHGNQNAPKELGMSKTIGYGSDSDHQATTTKSGIITSDKESEYAGKLANNFDKNEVQSELDTSVRVSQSFDATRKSVKQEINKEIDEANKIIKDETGTYSPQEKDKANEKIEEMQNFGILVDMVNGALYNPSDTLAGTAVNTLSPALVYKVGQYFKNPNSEYIEGSPQHLLAQALVAGVTAGLAGNDAFSSALSAGGAEALAPKLASVLYGIDKKDVSKMTAEQKQTISAIISLGSTAVGATSGSVTDVVASGEAGRVAVEENAGATRANSANTIQQLRTANYYRLTREYEQLTGKRYATITGQNYQPSQEAINSLQREIEQIGREKGSVPFNFASFGVGQSGAFNQAKRDLNIPRSQQPLKVYTVPDNTTGLPLRVYEFEVISRTTGKKEIIRMRNDNNGHFFGTSDSQNRGSHFNAPLNENLKGGNHYDYKR